jgi:hypothetical protein
VGFVLNRRQPIFLWSLFKRESSILINRPVDEMSWPTSRNAKVIRHIVPFKMSNLHYNRWEVGQLLKMTINPPLEVHPLGYGWIYKILSYQNPIWSYNKEFPNLHLFGFCNNEFQFVRLVRKQVHCKHMYYVL